MRISFNNDNYQRSLKVHVITFILLCIVTNLVYANSNEISEDFYEGKADGWFWYEDPPIEEIVDEKAEEIKQAPPSPPPSNELKPLSTEWLKKNLETYRNSAIDEPTNENVATYLYLQRLMMDKASTFSRQVKFVTQADPKLDESARNPVASYASRITKIKAANTRDNVISMMAEKGGLFFFYKSDCPYCMQMAPQLKALERIYGMTIYPISIDGRELPGGQFPNYVIDEGQAASLDVQMTPSIFLVNPPKGITPVTYGVVSQEELKSRIVTAAARTGWVDMKTYSEANAVLDDPTPPTPSEANLSNDLTKPELLKALKEIYQ
jgi:conjugal transfer pilus assembly protein TraF